MGYSAPCCCLLCGDIFGLAFPLSLSILFLSFSHFIPHIYLISFQSLLSFPLIPFLRLFPRFLLCFLFQKLFLFKNSFPAHFPLTASLPFMLRNNCGKLITQMRFQLGVNVMLLIKVFSKETKIGTKPFFVCTNNPARILQGKVHDHSLARLNSHVEVAFACTSLVTERSPKRSAHLSQDRYRP